MLRHRLESWAFDAAVAELVDAPGLGLGAARREGSSPFGRTIIVTTLHPFAAVRLFTNGKFHDKRD
jgi:hypothetical protein